MGKKMRLLPSLSKSYSSSASLWQWPSCKHPKTHSFRVDDDMFKTVNSVYFDASSAATTTTTGDCGANEMILTTVTTKTRTTTTPESWFTNSSDESGAVSFSTVSEPLESGEESLEMVIRGLRSERLFFEPGNTNSILEEAKNMSVGFPFKESLVLAMDSEDPYVDFRTSMEEMVEAHGLKDWDCLEELLSWYLRVNGKKNHGFIVGAFVDLLVGIAAAAAASSSKATVHPPCCGSSSSDSCSVSLYSLEEDQDEEKVIKEI